MRIKLRFSAFRNLRFLNIGIGIMIRIMSVATLMLKKAKLMVAVLTQRPRSVTSQKALVGVHWKENTERNAMVMRVTMTSIPKQIRRINESKTRRYWQRIEALMNPRVRIYGGMLMYTAYACVRVEREIGKITHTTSWFWRSVRVSSHMCFPLPYLTS